MKSLLLILLPLQVFAQQNFIQLNGGEIRNYTSIEVIQEKYEKPYFKTNTDETYRNEQVEAFKNTDGYFIKNELTISKKDFAKQIQNGRVEVYSYDLTANYIQTGANNTREYFAYKKRNGKLKQMIYKNLIADLYDNVESVKILNKIRASKRISPLYYVLGGATILSSIVIFNISNGNLTTPIFITGVGLFSIPWILNSRRQKRMNKAVKIYNN